MRIIIFLLIIPLSVTLTQCTSLDLAQRVTRQGNLLPKSKIDRIKLGMSKDDVAILIGNSLLSPTFNKDRWDYVSTQRKGHGKIHQVTLSLYFVKDTLIRMESHPK